MNLLTPHVRKYQDTEVVELEKQSLQLIGKLLHRFIRDEGTTFYGDRARLTLQHLNYQSSVVYLNAEAHYVAGGEVLDPLDKKELEVVRYGKSSN